MKIISRNKTGDNKINNSEKDGSIAVKLSHNELPFPPCPGAINAFQEIENGLNRYPDRSQLGLRKAISEVYGVPVENLFASNGSQEAIGLVIRSSVKANQTIVISENSFVVAEIYAKSIGAKIIKCKEQDERVSVEEILRNINGLTRLVYICSPNNPTGTYTTIKELYRLDSELPKNVILMIDAAYSEFVFKKNYDCGIKSLFNPKGRVVVTHTLSKAYGLAGLRIGWAVAPDKVMAAVSKIIMPFNTNKSGLRAAEASIRDQKYLRKCTKKIRETRLRFVKALLEIGLKVVPSDTNFVLIRFEDGYCKAKSLDMKLKSANVFGCLVSDDPNAYRISIGTDEDMNLVIQLIKEWAKKMAKEPFGNPKDSLFVPDKHRVLKNFPES